MRPYSFPKAALTLMLGLWGGIPALSAKQLSVSPMEDALSRLKTSLPLLECKNRQCEHKIPVRLKLLTARGTPLVLVATSQKMDGAHSEGAAISLFVYAKRHGKWQRKKYFPGFTQAGSFGRMDPKGIRLVPLNRSYILFLRSGFTGQGYYSERISVYAPGKPPREVLTLCSGEDNEGAISTPSERKFWNARYRLHKNGLLEVVLKEGKTGPQTTSRWRFRKGRFHPASKIDPRLTECL